ncbi:putative glutathione S-transferase GSTU6 [Triticum urartu]|uniref:glutathione transferase n=1 Tax=Triticum urartu TaxID=4572 RepID=M8A3R3_TRIUA|nr:probable glutathione S-transferase GSTU6 [Triticum urartu]EMS66611.1 putative glutathione S-transferase GSTU6 [Triticum urartu]
MAGEGDLKLLGLLVSPFVTRVRLALHIKGLSYEYIETDVLDKGELLLRYNPVHKKVPVLIHNGVPLCESQIIVQYVDEVWAAAGAPILPADAYQRATARFWAVYVDDKLFPAWLGILLAPTEAARAEKVGETLAALAQLEVAAAECLDGGKRPFFAGDSIGFLDLAVGCNMFWMEALRRMFGVTFLDAGKTPLLVAWAERFAGTEAATAVVPDPDAAVAFARKLQAKYGSAPPAN